MKFIAKIFLLAVLGAIALESTAFYEILDAKDFLKKEIEAETEGLEDEELKEKEENRKKNRFEHGFDGFIALPGHFKSFGLSPLIKITARLADPRRTKLFLLYSQLKLCA